MNAYTCIYMQVNRIVEGRTALHEACKDGYISVLKTLLKFNPDLEKLVNADNLKHSLYISKHFPDSMLYTGFQWTKTNPLMCI